MTDETGERGRLELVVDTALRSADAVIGVIVGGAVFYVALKTRSVRDAALPVLIAEAGIGVALTTIVLTALAIFATFFDSAYRRVIEAASSMGAALLPYRAVALVATAAGLVALVAAVIWPALGTVLGSVALGLATGLTAWAIVGSVQLVRITAQHAQDRALLMRKIEEAQVEVKELRRSA